MTDIYGLTNEQKAARCEGRIAEIKNELNERQAAFEAGNADLTSELQVRMDEHRQFTGEEIPLEVEAQG